MFGDLLGKLQEAQQKMAESKERLAQVFVDGEAGDGAVKVTISGNREVKNIEIAPRLLSPDSKDELEDLLLTALNRTLKNVETTWEAEMKNVAGGMMGGLGM
jgi:DNA-binding YbaB/EbfC family protein